MGATLITFRRPDESAAARTSLDHEVVAAEITPMQRKVLVELCRPFKDGGRYAAPATNVEIAAELVLSVDAVKTHMRGLFERFAVGDLPQNQKRAKVAELALERGIVSLREL